MASIDRERALHVGVPVRIVHVDSAAGWRGGQNQVLLAVAGMLARGHDVRVACRHGGELARRARARGLDVLELPFGGDLDPRALWALRRALRAFDADVVQLHDPHAVAAGVMATRGWVRAPALVATRRVDFHVKGMLSQAKYRACKRIVAVSAAIVRVLQGDGLPSASLRLVYEGVPDRPPQPGGRGALAALGVAADAAVVGNVAALSDHKDHATLLAAWPGVVACHPRARLVIVGDGELRTRLRADAARLGIADSVVFAGFRADLDALLPAFDVFCLSSHMEGLGTSLLDAMCFGRPIVATHAGGIPEAVEDGVTGRIVPVRDPVALGAALVDVLGHASRAAAWGAAGRARFERHFTDGRMVTESLAVYDEVC